MRHARWSLAAALALAVGGLAHGQGANIPQFQPAGFSSALTGIKPTDVQFRQVDTQALLRCLHLPAWRVSRIDPMIALRAG